MQPIVSVREVVQTYIKQGEKAKLCIIDLFLEKEVLREHEIINNNLLARYYANKIYSISQIYNEMRNDGIIQREAAGGQDKLVSVDDIRNIFQQFSFIISSYLLKDVWGKGDVVKTLDPKLSYLVQKIIIRGGSISRSDFLSDIARDKSNNRVASDYAYADFDATIRQINTDLDDLTRTGYVTKTASGYRVSDFVMHDFLANPVYATRILSSLSENLWNGFEFQHYFEEIDHLGQHYKQLKIAISEVREKVQRNDLIDALVSLNLSVETLSTEIYKKVIGTESKIPNIFARLQEIWKKQNVSTGDAELDEAGVKAATAISSLLFVAKWIRDKSSHSLIQPTADAVRLSLANVLVCIDVCVSLNLLT